MKERYRLKSNPETIVEKDGDFLKVVWTNTMKLGPNASWMRALWDEANVIELTKQENQQVDSLLGLPTTGFFP
jgi:hypothetical protein